MSYPKSYYEWVDQMTTNELIEVLWNRMSEEEQEEFEAEDVDSEEEEEEPQNTLAAFLQTPEATVTEDDADAWFDRKYPNATCLRCETHLKGSTVVFCGGGGGACETWYCSECHKKGTDDCSVCKD